LVRKGGKGEGGEKRKEGRDVSSFSASAIVGRDATCRPPLGGGECLTHFADRGGRKRKKKGKGKEKRNNLV